jgi:hypothetical protein
MIRCHAHCCADLVSPIVKSIFSNVAISQLERFHPGDGIRALDTDDVVINNVGFALA